MKHSYHVEFRTDDLKWRRMVGSQGNRSYATGGYHALLGFNPRPAYRLVRDDGKVIEEWPAAGPVQVGLQKEEEER